MARRVLRTIPAILVAASLFLVPYAYSEMRQKTVPNFRVVEQGKLYRSGQVSEKGLERVIHDYGIKTVISFRDAEEGKTEPPAQWEEALCAVKGVNYHRFSLKYWSFDEKLGCIPADENVRKFLDIVSDPKNQPVLVHCFRGIHRTGMYCAIYRMDRQGWSNDDAMHELQELGYDNLQKELDVRGYLERYSPKRKGP